MSNRILFDSEKPAKHLNGFLMLFLITLLTIGSFAVLIIAAINDETSSTGLLISIGIVGIIFFPILFAGLKVVNPKEAIVLVLFGKYFGTINQGGFYWVNPFCTAFNPTAKPTFTERTPSGSITVSPSASKKISLRTNTLNNDVQKVNDELGNPIMIGAVVIWEIQNATKAVFNVENYHTYVSTQCDAVIRNVARAYPYDTSKDGDEWSLRGSSQQIANVMQEELQRKVEDAGIAIIDVRITHLAYAPEIASAMLQRQQAAAIIDARQKIVEGAVGMVDMALKKLSENNIINLDEERKAAMVSNLLVVLCGNKDTQPIINSGSLY